MRIAPSFVSRVSNCSVLERSNQISLTALLKQRQIRCYKSIQVSPEVDFARQLVCDNQGVPINWYIRRKRGRPRQKWTTSVFHFVIASRTECEVLHPNRYGISVPNVAGNNRNKVNVPFFQPSLDSWW